jgi:hypothetical protein
MKYGFLSLIILFIVAISSCKKPDEYPVEPIITIKSFYSVKNAQGFDQQMTVILNFTDGDGDVGYKPQGQNDAIFDDSLSLYYRNYNASLSVFRNGAWKDTTTAKPLGGRIPYLTPEGKNKSLKGEIQCDFLLAGLIATQDTFRLKVFIYDRALHKSNVDTTLGLILNTQ